MKGQPGLMYAGHDLQPGAAGDAVDCCHFFGIIFIAMNYKHIRSTRWTPSAAGAFPRRRYLARGFDQIDKTTCNASLRSMQLLDDLKHPDDMLVTGFGHSREPFCRCRNISCYPLPSRVHDAKDRLSSTCPLAAVDSSHSAAFSA
jgi:hypothetical protein